MKKSIKLLLCTLAVLLAVPLAMCAAETLGIDSFSLAPKAEAATIVDSGKCGANVTYTLDSDGLLTISGSGKMYDDTWQNASQWKSTFSVEISDGVTSIGSEAFYGYDSLTSITIPNSVTSIGNEAFTLYACRIACRAACNVRSRKTRKRQFFACAESRSRNDS